jgi:tripartite-type tricarboxylate transporter receptor subunit TctC
MEKVVRPKHTRLKAAAAALLSVGILSVPPAWSEAYPNKTIRIIVPFSAGSGTDIVARTVATALSTSMGQAVVVENRSGAGGTIGAAQVAKANPDGYTLLVQSSSHTIAPLIYKRLPYDTLKDFAPISPLAVLPNVLIVSPSKQLKSVKDLVEQAKAKSNQYTFASAGVGGATHINAEKFRLAAGLDLVHIPFKGTPEGVSEVMTGRVDFFFSPIVSVLSHIREGRLVALGMGTAKRSPLLPDVPTTIEAGVPNSDYMFWVGAFAPANTPRPIVEKLNAEIRKVLMSPAVTERFASLGAEPFSMGVKEFDAHIRAELKNNAVLVKAADIKAD